MSLAVWLAKAIADICIGFFQLLVGLIAVTLAGTLYILTYAVEAFGNLWIMAFPNSDRG